MQLLDWGWTPDLAAAFAADPRTHERPGRIVRISGATATVTTTTGDVQIDTPRARTAESLVVGDWATIFQPDGTQARLGRLLPRKTSLARRAAGRRARRQLLAANVDVAFILSSLDADFNERRIERYLVVVHDGGCRPVLLLTKAGACPEPESFVARARRVAPGVDVHAIDVVAGIQQTAAASYVEAGRTAVLLGSSGVGKSTLLNHLAGRSHMATHAVRARDGRGQHTTSHRELFAIPGGGLVIDTPGLRQLSPSADATAFAQAFSDIEALTYRCRFRDCSHEHEPECAVRIAVTAGSLDEARYRSYLGLRSELTVTALQMPVHEQRRRERAFGKIAREIMKAKRHRR